MVDISPTNLESVVTNANLAEKLDEETLTAIGEQVVNDYEQDEDSRSGWTEKNEQWMKLASQVMEEKSYPWPNAANVKYPLLTTAAMQFHARAQQSLIKGVNLVKTRPVGKDPTGEKRSRAERVSDYMSYQLLQQMDNWEEDMDRLLLVLPIIGLCFKKVYYSPSKRTNVSELVLPKDLVVNYHATNFARARKTHIIYKDETEVLELQRKEIYLDIPLMPISNDPDEKMEDLTQGLSPATHEAPPRKILEAHTWWDLNDDGHKEPYIITVDEATRKVLRITARFKVKDVEFSPSDPDMIAAITPTEYFVRYVFLPDLTSPIYGLGFGSVLGPLNSAVNTLTNLLIDAGTLSNLQSGFLSRGVRLSRGGTTRFRPGEWKTISSTGDDLRKGIYPLPVKEPSSTLFQLLGLLVQSGEKVGSIADIMLGENPGQNQPYSTTSAVLEQGMKVFVGIYKRTYRALTQEYKFLFQLNSVYLDPEVYAKTLDDPMADKDMDFEQDSLDVLPAADPDVVTEMQKLKKAEALLQKLAAGLPLNPQLVTQRILEAEGHEDIEQLMTVEPPQPPFELQLKAKQHEDEMRMREMELQLEATVKEYEALKDQAQAIVNFAKAQATMQTTEQAPLKMFLEMLDKDKDREAKADTDVLNALTQMTTKDKELEARKQESKNKPPAANE